MNNLILTILCLFLTSCSVNLNKCDNSFKEVSGIVTQKGQLVWEDTALHIGVYVCTEKPVFSTDVPLAFLQIRNYNRNKVYEFYDLGTNYDVTGNSILIYEENLTRYNSLEGWYIKDEVGDFVTMDNKKLIYEHNLLYEKKSNDYYEVINKKFAMNSEISSSIENVKLDIGSLYKYDKKKVNKVSKRVNDIFKAKSGIYYIPPPGTAVTCILDFNFLSKKFGN